MSAVTHQALIVLALSAALATSPGEGLAQESRADTVSPGEEILREVHRRYASTRFRTLSFTQRTTFPDGRVEWWYEAEAIPGRARVDVAPFTDGNAQIFRNDSAYVFQKGELARTAAGLAVTMWTLMDMYAIPPAETAAALRRRSFDLERVHERSHDGRDVYVIGALAGDTTSAQVWLDKEHLYTVKMIVPTQAGRRVTDVSGHTFQNGGWIEGQIVVSLNGVMTLKEEYNDVQTNVTFPSGFFEPDEYRPPHWVTKHPLGG